MKNTLSLLALFFLPLLASSQVLYQYFDGDNPIPNHILEIILDSTDANNIWQIGPPQKVVFDSASTVPNVLITDTINTYPINDTSRFQLGLTTDFEQQLNWGIFALQWNQKLDMDSLKDGGIIEFSIDSGNTWASVFDNPYVYNFYGYEFGNVDTIGTGSLAFTGTDSTWRNIWLCYEADWLVDNYNMGSLKVRFTFISDSVETGQDGWMIDNMMANITLIHTIGEKDQKNYLEVYPNPTSDRINISARKMQEFHITEKLELFNEMGQLVKSYARVPTKFFINVRDLPAGKYYLRVQTNMETQTFPIIVQRD